ncbi:apolipoprotein N-acyltransferase [Halostreptopolyspora alba]|uniref:Apolipoprotein N-acyltransferase n=1 Tax=Halostreptopolyspora alba TaxID=2487137 RepID=A0A3N0EG42_9ACTN|nr:apolipoprotein N-acyltransferase [Nocardiopsaceae bacterium YIM 96095]
MVAEGVQWEKAEAGAVPEGSDTAKARRHWSGSAALWRVLAAVGSGVAQLLALPPHGLWWLAPLSATLLALAVLGTRPRRAAWLGAVAGAALMAPLVRWQDVFGVDVWLLTAAAETLYYVPMAIALALVLRLTGWPVWTAAVWVLQEAVRARFPFDGFPWGKLAFSQPGGPFVGYAALGSSALVTFVVALAGGMLLWAILRLLPTVRRNAAQLRSPNARETRPPRFAVLAGVAALGGVVASAVVGAAVPTIAVPTERDTVTVALVQGNVPRAGEMDILGERAQVLRNHVNGVHRLADRVRTGEVERPDMVILPENASDIDAYTDEDAAAMISDAADDVEAPLLFGITRFNDDGRTREVRSVVWEPGAGEPGEHYSKRFLVPFGEYIPYRDFFTRFVSRLEQVPTDSVPGTEPGDVTLGGTTIATAICFDVAFDRPVREAVAEGGEIIAVPTNNANYNFTGQTDQQLAITQLRAVEHGRPAVVAATSGVSAVVAPDGGVSYRSPEAESAEHVAEVPAMSGQTVATRIGVWPELALCAVAAGAVAVAVVSARRPRR